MNKSPEGNSSPLYLKTYHDLAYRFEDLCGSIYRWSTRDYAPVSHRHTYRAQLNVSAKELQRDDITGWVWELYYQPVPGTSIHLAKGKGLSITPGSGQPLTDAPSKTPLGTITSYRTGPATCNLTIEGLSDREVQRYLPDNKDRLIYTARRQGVMFSIDADLAMWIDEDLVKGARGAEMPTAPNWKRQGDLACVWWFLVYGEPNGVTQEAAAQQMEVSLRQLQRAIKDYRER